MATGPFDRLMDDLRVRLPGALDGTIRAELFRVMSNFFSISNCWTEQIDFAVEQAITSYELTPQGNATIHRLIGVLNQNGSRVNATMQTPGTIDLDWEPNEAATYTACVALNVADPVDRNGYPFIPQWVLDKYEDEILDGVLSRMMSQPAKTYSNPPLAMVHERRFNYGVNLARIEALNANTYRVQAWSFPRGGFITHRHR